MTDKTVPFSPTVPLAVAADRVITLKYALYDAQYDEMLEFREQLSYLHGGYEKRLRGLQKALEGLKPGDKTEVTLTASEAFGEPDPGLILTAPANAFPPEAHQLWAKVIGESDTGQQIEFTVVNIEHDTITVDGNHPFAGKRLRFIVEVQSVRDASEQERQQGFVGPN